MKTLASVLAYAASGRNGFRLVLAALLTIGIGCCTLYAQSGAGLIQGTVTDPTGAVIPGASVQVANSATGVRLNTKTNATGFYQVPDLFAGTYHVTVTAEGMKTFERTIDLLVAQHAEVNFTLQTGSITQKVVVQGNAVQLINTTSGSITSTLDAPRISQIPENGRDIINLVNDTTPGLSSCPESGSCSNGLSGPAMEYEVDGATLTNREFGGVHESQSQMVDPDSIREVQAETDGSGAEYDSPATVILSTRSGTDQLHGTMFYTAENNAFGIARQRQDNSNFVAPHYVRNEFGVSAGGPIVIPHLYNGHNRSFWFFAYERYSLAQDSAQLETVPTTAMRNGDFSGLTNSAGVFQQLYDPLTTANSASCAEPPADGGGTTTDQWCRTAFTNNQISPTRESPSAKILNDITPLPTNNEDPLVGSNLAALVPEYTAEPQFTFRLDQVFNQNNRAYLRYTQNLTNDITPRNDPVNESATLAADGFPFAASGLADDIDGTFAAALGFTHVFSPTFFSETVLSQTWMGEQNAAGGNPNLDYEQMLGVPNNFGETGFPYIEGIFQPFDGTQFQYGMTDILTDLDENLTKTIGRHTLLFGGRFIHDRFGNKPDEIKDTVEFDGQDTGLENPGSGTSLDAYSNTGNANADEFLGGAESYGVDLEPPYQHLRQLEIDGYLQDNYRIRPNLTLNLGVRYEALPAIWEGGGMMMGFDLKNDAIVTSGPLSQLIAEGVTTQAIISNDEYDGAKFETPAEAGMPSMLVDNYDNNWLPRLGAAWQPFGMRIGTVIRGAAGQYLYPIPIREAYREVNRNNPFTAGYSESYTNAVYSPDGQPNYLLRSNQPVTMGVNSAGVVDSSSTTAIQPGLSIVSIDPHFPPSKVTQGDLTIEQPTKWNSVVRVSYVFNHGSYLNQYDYYNAFPESLLWEVQTGTETPRGKTVGPTNANTGEGPYDNITYGDGNYQIQKSGWSNYNALQLNFQRLYRHGIGWQVSYVWSKSLWAGGDFGGENGDEYVPYSALDDSGPGVVTSPYGNVGPLRIPPSPPANVPDWGFYRALDRWENYMVNTNDPRQALQFNAIVDLPFGQGKRLLGSAGKALNEVVGGWQLAGTGSLVSQDFAVNTGNWGPVNQIHVYKHAVPITDCRSGQCLKSYLWWNGYIAPSAIAGNSCAGSSGKVIDGLPSSYVPYQTPIDTTCGSKYYDDNEVAISNVAGQSNNTAIAFEPYGSAQNQGVSESAIYITNPFTHTILNGPMNFNAALSLFKVFPIGERWRLRINVDAFNAFNIQGYTNPSSSDGTETVQAGGVGANSYNPPRQVQFTARLTF